MRLLGLFQTLYLFIFFYEKILHVPKAQKAQKRNQAKAQNARSKQK